jgi:acid phosphatase
MANAHRRTTLTIAVLLLAVLALGLIRAVPAGAITTRTAATPAEIRSYYGSGAWAHDVAAVYRSANKALRHELKAPDVTRPAIVLDIDDTSLSNYPCLDAVDFSLSGLVTCVVDSSSVAIPPAIKLVRLALRRDVAVFFVTGAPTNLIDLRRGNLTSVGFPGPFTVIGRPLTDTNTSVVPYKSSVRRFLEGAGYQILVNVGDQQSDLDGGFARQTFKLPNLIYLTT